MNALECKAYLERIGYQEEPHTDKDCLEKLMELQLQSVPFENLEVFKEKRVPSLKTEDIFHKIVHQERGGCCFELNKIFYELLKGLGFDVTPLAIRMLWSPDDFRRILHRATMVVLEDGPYYCDVGYGGPGPRYPVKLEDGLHTEKNGTFRVTMEPQGTNGEILMERKQDGEYRPLMSFTLHPAQDVDFEVLNYYCSTSPDMWLTQKNGGQHQHTYRKRCPYRRHAHHPERRRQHRKPRLRFARNRENLAQDLFWTVIDNVEQTGEHKFPGSFLHMEKQGPQRTSRCGPCPK